MLKLHYRHGEWADLLNRLPGRSRSKIQNKANQLGMVRDKSPARTKAKILEDKRVAMRMSRIRNPQRLKDLQRAWYAKNREAILAKNAKWARKHFFRNRASRRCGASATQLFMLWVRQRGRCAISGRTLDRSAHLDHIIPKARGGDDCVANYRWVCPEVNLVKRDLTDAEFLTLCRNCMEWIGERIAAVERAP